MAESKINWRQGDFVRLGRAVSEFNKKVNALQREESICETVTLWPKNYDYSTMAVSKAGIPSTYSEIIMEKSGFTKDIAIQEI